MKIMILAPILLILVLTVFYVISIYNNLINIKELVGNAKAQIATQIESRWDALTSLISATKQYSTHESETLINITKNRQPVNSASSTQELNQAELSYQGSLSRLMAVAESYPDLKASNLYRETMTSINKYEDNVRLSRMTFNDTVTKLNRLIKIFPSNIIAKMFGFNQEVYLELSENKKEMPTWE